MKFYSIKKSQHQSEYNRRKLSAYNFFTNFSTILFFRWQIVDPVSSRNVTSQNVIAPPPPPEDISDEHYIAKHERALIEERKKFQSYLKFPLTRSRANRRIDSRAESSGANTPDPTSPAPNTPSVDLEVH